jgi:hypothetical protein
MLDIIKCDELTEFGTLEKLDWKMWILIMSEGSIIRICRSNLQEL